MKSGDPTPGRSGDRIVYDRPQNGYPKHQETAREHLVVGRTYTIAREDVWPDMTETYLAEVPGIAFNSVLFTPH